MIYQPDKQELNIGIVGAGSIVRDRHLPALQKIDGVHVAAVCNSSLESGHRFCEEFGLQAKVVSSWLELVAMKNLDIVWIGTTPCLHNQVTLAALAAEKHVFCQARMAMDLTEAKQMYAASQQLTHLVTMLCPPPHGMAAGRFMKQLLDEDVIGTPRYVRLRSLSDAFIDPDEPAHWRQRRELSGLNVMTLGIYAEVLQRWLGPIRWVSAMGKVFNKERQGYMVEIPDVLGVLCEFDNGAQGTLEFNAIAANAPGDSMEIYGTAGTVAYDFENDQVFLSSLAGAMAAVEIDSELIDSWTVEEDFIHAVRHPSNPRPSPTFAEGLSYMRVVQAVADSIEQQCLITIEE